MKIQLALIGLFAIGMTSCENGTNTTTSTSTDSSTVAAAPAADPNMITTTTTTTTTRPAFQPRPDVQYMDVRSKKMITVRVDTVHHYIVNAQTNQPVDWIVEPGTTDTFYGRNMMRANGYINYSNWTYDESLGNNASTSTTDMNSTETGNMDAGTTTSDASGANVRKIKSNSNETKVKMDDGSKIKSKGDETKIKNH